MPSEAELPLSGPMPLMLGAAGGVVSIVAAKPAASAVAVPSVAAPSVTVTVVSAAALPEMVSAVALVMPSEEERPLSGPMPPMIGAAGGAVSTVRATALEAAPTLPAASRALAV